MSDQQPLLRVVQCPKCGSSVNAVRPGTITTCGYCGSSLEVVVGASGNPIARLASIEASTTYLARAEQLRRVQEQLAERNWALSNLVGNYKQVRETIQPYYWACWSTAVVGGLMTGLVLVLSLGGVPLCLLTSLAVLACGIAGSLYLHGHLATIDQAYSAEAAQIGAERNRLAGRVAELEAGLAELASKL